MTWVKLDDQFPINRKVGALPDTVFRLHVEALCWCARNRTDGVVSRADLPQVTRIGKPARLVTMLVQRGLWHEHTHRCDSPGCPTPGPDGWVIHDYLAYNPSREQLDREREQSTERGRRWRDLHKQKRNAVGNAVTTPLVTGLPSRPVPTPGGVLLGGSPPGEDQLGPEPPRTCPKHTNTADPPPCGPCRAARQAHDRWAAEHTRRLADAPRCPDHRGQLAATCAPCRSERLAARESA